MPLPQRFQVVREWVQYLETMMLTGCTNHYRSVVDCSFNKQLDTFKFSPTTKEYSLFSPLYISFIIYIENVDSQKCQYVHCLIFVVGWLWNVPKGSCVSCLVSCLRSHLESCGCFPKWGQAWSRLLGQSWENHTCPSLCSRVHYLSVPIQKISYCYRPSFFLSFFFVFAHWWIVSQAYLPFLICFYAVIWSQNTHHSFH